MAVSHRHLRICDKYRLILTTVTDQKQGVWAALQIQAVQYSELLRIERQ